MQFSWWIWNEELPTAQPAIGVVPYSNVQAFSLGVPFGLALLTLAVSKLRAPSRWPIARNVALVCLATWPVMFLSSLPATLLNLVGICADPRPLFGNDGAKGQHFEFGGGSLRSIR